MTGHPRLKAESIRAELGGLFEVLAMKDGVYDMALLATDDGARPLLRRTRPCCSVGDLPRPEGFQHGRTSTAVGTPVACAELIPSGSG